MSAQALLAKLMIYIVAFPQFMLGVIAGVLHSIGFNKCIMTCFHYDSIYVSNILALYVLPKISFSLLSSISYCLDSCNFTLSLEVGQCQSCNFVHLQQCVGYSGSFAYLQNQFFYNHKVICWDFDCDCIKSIDQVWKNQHLEYSAFPCACYCILVSKIYFLFKIYNILCHRKFYINDIHHIYFELAIIYYSKYLSGLPLLIHAESNGSFYLIRVFN